MWVVETGASAHGRAMGRGNLKSYGVKAALRRRNFFVPVIGVVA